jgi:hypothetical protein
MKMSDATSGFLHSNSFQGWLPGPGFSSVVSLIPKQIMAKDVDVIKNIKSISFIISRTCSMAISYRGFLEISSLVYQKEEKSTT